jgi:hypothetical protein
LLEGVILDAVPDLLGDLQRFFFGESGQEDLVLVPAEAGGLATLFFVQLANDVLADQVAVGVVYLFEFVYVGHEDAHGLLLGGRHLQAVLELLVESVLDEEAGQIVAADQMVQGAVEVGPHGVPVGELKDRVAQKDPVPVREPAIVVQGLVVDDGALASAEIPDEVRAGLGLSIDLRVPRGDLDVPDHHVCPERVTPQNQRVLLEREEVPEAGSPQDYQVRPGVREDSVVLSHA